ncbi:hypothetical protein CKO15_09900 [Halorhodospira abdelmalekii]|nr:DUF3634 family protein [Halorhodospira abdelmalekii]MBK1735591.1 hypothetical protein [Halorhodospira abdelmalekii]
MIAIFLLLLAGLAVGVAWMLWDARYVFIVAIENGKIRIKRGSPPEKFLRSCRIVVYLHKLQRGKIYGERTAAGVELSFSREIPERPRQAFRNVWDSPPSGGGDTAKRRA